VQYVRAGNTGIQGGAQATIRRANIVAGNYGVILGQSSLLSDSFVTTTGGAGGAIAVNGEFAEMRNVTAVVRGAGGAGVVALPTQPDRSERRRHWLPGSWVASGRSESFWRVSGELDPVPWLCRAKSSR
jgi:hypothetical protein